MINELIVQKDPKSPISEVFRTLRTNIQFMNTNKDLKTLLITSTVTGEGKSLIAANLAATFAQANKRVVLIDCDMRKGRQHNIFGTTPRPGLSNFLSGIGEDGKNSSSDLSTYIRETQIPNLYLLPSGNIPPNPSELIASEKMVYLLKELSELCDIVILDGTPSLIVTDSIILSRFVDSTILVAAQNETKIDELNKVKRDIDNVGGKIAGVVINMMEIDSKKYQDRYYYYGHKSNLPIKSKKKQRNTSKIIIEDQDYTQRIIENSNAKADIEKEEFTTQINDSQKKSEILDSLNDFIEKNRKEE